MAYELEGIAKKLGIAVKFSDGGLVRKEYEVSAETIRFFIETFGYKADNETDIANSLHKLENARWQQTLENIYVVPQDNIEFDIVVPEEWQNEYFDVRLFAKGEKTAEKIAYEISSRQEAALIKGKNLRRLYVRITSPVKIGYYDIELSVKGKKFKTILAVAPIRCYEPPAMERKLWGFAVQLYSVKSNRNWGVGDFTDLENIVRICGRAGASVIGLNPLNVLMHNFPENASPYSSISRLFLNPIYIDVERVPEFEENDLQLIEGTLAELRNSELIQYGKVYPLKISVLEKCYQRFKKTLSKGFAGNRGRTWSVWPFFKRFTINSVRRFGEVGRPGRQNTAIPGLPRSKNLPKNRRTESNFSNICSLRPIVSSPPRQMW